MGRSVYCWVVFLSVCVGAGGFVPWKWRFVAAVVDERQLDVNLEVVVDIEKGGR